MDQAIADANQYGLVNTNIGKDLPFTSMADMAAANENFMDQFNTESGTNLSVENAFPGMSTGDIIDSMNNRQAVGGIDVANIRDLISKSNMQRMMNAPRTQMNEMNTYGNRDFTNVGGLGIANEPDVEQVEYLGSPSKFQNFKDALSQGLGSFRNKAGQGWNFAQELPGMAMSAMTGIPGIGMLMGALGNAFEDRTLGTSNVVDEYGNVFDSASLNKQNALGGGYTDAARSSRRALARINNMLERKALKKTYSKKNLDKLQEFQRLQQELDNKGYTGTPGGNTGSGAFAKFDNTSKNYGPHTKGGGNQGGGFSGAGAGTGSRGPRSRDGGIIMDKNFYANGGLATLFTRRG